MKNLGLSSDKLQCLLNLKKMCETQSTGAKLKKFCFQNRLVLLTYKIKQNT